MLALLATFFPAYLPRVMIATRPTLRTELDQISQDVSKVSKSDSHFIVLLTVVVFER